MTFNSLAVVDWSAGNDTGARARRDAIWLGRAKEGRSAEPEYLRNRDVARARLEALIDEALVCGDRLVIGFDFPFGYPRGFCRALTGDDNPLVLWDWFSEHLEDTPKGNARFALAGRLNQLFAGVGPFWFNGTAQEVEGLPRKGSQRTTDHGLPERRLTEERASGAFSCWQMGGAGAVGGQVMTGLACLALLRRRFPGKVSVWPFEPLNRPVTFLEVWPSLISSAVRAAGDAIKDRAQVRLLSQALAGLCPEDWAEMPTGSWVMMYNRLDTAEPGFEYQIGFYRVIGTSGQGERSVTLSGPDFDFSKSSTGTYLVLLKDAIVVSKTMSRS
ncbi:MAG: molybdopterin guanine dinucleotide synthesis [Pseudomonadota bacterium]